VDDVKRPDRLIFDLDPAPDVAWEAVKSAARDVRANLKKFGLVSFLKTSGGKGLHIVVPFARGPNWSEPKRFARAFSNAMATDEPERFTINSRKDVRKGRIFVDYLRNDETASAVAAYAVRARPGAPVSLPIDWKELSSLKGGAAFSNKDALKRRADPCGRTSPGRPASACPSAQRGGRRLLSPTQRRAAPSVALIAANRPEASSRRRPASR
jgi:bifunctional non-homologous end joining protein LigD